MSDSSRLEDDEASSTLPDFSGLVVLLNVNVGSAEGAESYTLEYCAWKTVGDRLFLSGRVPEIDTMLWASGRECSVAWSEVVSFTLFRSREQYIEAVQRAYRLSRKGLRRWLSG